MIRALVFDLDNTLLTSTKTLSAKTIDALRKCRDRGITSYVATARPPLLDRMLGWDDTTMGLFRGGIFYNGGSVLVEALTAGTRVSDAARYDQLLPEPLTTSLRKIVSRQRGELRSINLCLQLSGERHAFLRTPAFHNCEAWGLQPEDSLAIPSLSPRQHHELPTIKALIYCHDLVDSKTAIPERMAREIIDACGADATAYVTDDSRCIQITGKNVNKFTGLQRLCDQSGLEIDEVAAFGDDVNDVEMLAHTPVSIAMGNGCPEAQSVAAHITLDNDSDGIHHALKNLLSLI